MNSKELFSNKAENYLTGRPTYSTKIIDYLYHTVGFSTASIIADIGSGTGIFAKQLLEKGSIVICVEPNDDMRNVSQNELNMFSNVSFTDGDAEKTKLSDNSVDFVTAAQSFHWFDTKKFKIESKRILKAGGKSILLWNTRDTEDEINIDNYQIFAKYCPHFKGFSGGIEKDDERIVQYFDGKYETVEFDNPVSFDKERFISRSLSGSYSLNKNDEHYEKYIDELYKLFDKYAINGTLIIPNKSVAYIGCIK